jgi:formylglycine-generating enzyme
MRDGWLSPRRLLLGSIWLVASCAAIGLSAASLDAPNALKAGLRAVAAAASHQPQSLVGALRLRAARVAKRPCPAEMVLVESACVDRYEAHLLEKSEGGKLTPHAAHERPEHDAKRYVAASNAGEKPQAYICQIDAKAACENAGKRLCTLSEWYRACTGPRGTTYPYGPKYQARRCNVAKPHLLSMLHGDSVSNWSYANFNDPKLALTPGFLALTGEYEGCQSEEGVHDMVGNLHEWVSDRVDGTLRSKLPTLAVLRGRVGRHSGNGIFMGGFFSTLNQHGEGCTFATAAHDVGYHDYSTGFRCCKDSESP